ncbi:hypothetical protein, partial [Rheinheimera mesophila]|uniref:hypothetical protein n=1 Tax=Rheinheimera mesophila TaxID=1547515 RepID=UPI001C8A3D4D
LTSRASARTCERRRSRRLQMTRLVMFYGVVHKRLPFAKDFSKRHFGTRKNGCKKTNVNNQTLNETQRSYLNKWITPKNRHKTKGVISIQIKAWKNCLLNNGPSQT